MCIEERGSAHYDNGLLEIILNKGGLVWILIYLV
jgi:hypothetical protein